MALQLGALRDALLESGASPEKATKASEEAATSENRLGGIDDRVSVLTWMVGTNVALSLSLLGGAVAIWSKIGDLGVQIATLHRL